MKFSKFLTQADLDEVIHSSGYAKAAFGKKLGSASGNMTFEQRMQIEDKRKNVRAYNNSRIAMRGVARSTRGVTPQEVAGIEAKNYLSDIKNRQSPTSPGSSATPAAAPTQYTFREPPARKPPR